MSVERLEVLAELAEQKAVIFGETVDDFIFKEHADTAAALRELIAVKMAEPAAVIDDNHELTIDGSWIGHVPWLPSNMRLIRKPE